MNIENIPFIPGSPVKGPSDKHQIQDVDVDAEGTEDTPRERGEIGRGPFFLSGGAVSCVPLGDAFFSGIRPRVFF